MSSHYCYQCIIFSNKTPLNFVCSYHFKEIVLFATKMHHMPTPDMYFAISSNFTRWNAMLFDNNVCKDFQTDCLLLWTCKCFFFVPREHNAIFSLYGVSISYIYGKQQGNEFSSLSTFSFIHLWNLWLRFLQKMQTFRMNIHWRIGSFLSMVCRIA